MRFLWGFVTALVIFILGGLAVVFTGVFNVAAVWPDNALVTWALHTTMHRSVELRAGTGAPAQFTDAQVSAGAHLYNETCIYCHGAPGKDPADIGKGLNPEPPFLPDTAAEWTSAQLFWIVKNGVRMTGMPAFGASHKDDELWNAVAFVQRLPKMTPEQYDKMVQ